MTETEFHARFGNGRFAPRQNDAELIELARHVLFHAAERLDIDPTEVPERAYDGALQALGIKAPCAERTAKRLGYSWPELRTLLSSEERNATKNVAHRHRADARAFSDEEIGRALRSVADRLGVSTLSPSRYQQEWNLLEALDAQSWQHGGRFEQTMPKATQIQGTIGWKRALELAGLEVPTPQERGRKAQGLLVIDAVEVFLEEVGRLPRNRKELERWARTRNVSVTRRGARGVRPVLSLLTARRAEQGKWTPTRAPAPSECVPWPTEGAVPAGLPERQQRWDIAKVRAGLDRALQRMPPGKRLLTQPILRELAKGDPSIPHPATVQRVGKREVGKDFSQLRDEAVRRRNAGRSPRPRGRS